MINENEVEYFTELPEGYILMTNYSELFKTNNGGDILTVDNSIIRSGLIIILFNPVTNEYYSRYISESSNRINLLKYFYDKNLYIKETDLIWKK